MSSGLHLRSAAGDVDEALHRKIFVSAGVGIAFAASTTILRVAIKFRRFGLDDALAVAGLAFCLMTAISGARYYALNEHSTIAQTSRVALYYILAVGFDLTIWFSRLSIIVQIIKIHIYQRRLFAAMALFITALLILIAQIFWVCEPQNRQNSWKSDPVPQCILGAQVAITQVTTDAFADIILVVFPLLMLRFIQDSGAKAQKLRLYVSFIVGGLTTVVSVVHAIYLLQNTQISILVSNAELSVSVTISNFAVLAAAVHRLWNKYHPENRPEHPTMEFEERQVGTQRSTLFGTGSDSDARTRTIAATEGDSVNVHRERLHGQPEGEEK